MNVLHPEILIPSPYDTYVTKSHVRKFVNVFLDFFFTIGHLRESFTGAAPRRLEEQR